MEKQIKQKIDGAKRIVLSLHSSADLDSYGSNMGMFIYLKNIGKEVILLNGVDGIKRDSWKFLPGLENLTDGTVNGFDWKEGDLFLAIDIPAEGQIDSKNPPKFPLKDVITVVIDHHYDSNTKYGEVNFVEKRSSAAEVVLDLILGWDGEVTQMMTDVIYAGLWSDTGGFRFPIVNENSFVAAEKLCRLGARCNYIASKISTESLDGMRVVGLAIAEGRIMANRKVLFCVLTDEKLKKLGLNLKEMGSIHKKIGYYLSMIEEVTIGIIVREKGDGIWGVSFRANNPDDLRDVTVIASEFGGGGHKQAAACEMAASSEEELVDKVVKVIGEKYPDLYCEID